jgi:hypothetical protein
MFVCCECCVLSGRGLCDGLITRREESYRLWRIVVCDQETSKTRRLKPTTRLWKIQPQWVVRPGKQTNNNKHDKDIRMTRISHFQQFFCLKEKKQDCKIIMPPEYVLTGRSVQQSDRNQPTGSQEIL